MRSRRRAKPARGYCGWVTGAPIGRDQAVAALADGLAHAAGDPAVVFSGELDALAGSVAEACLDIEHDLPARLAIGRLHLLRFLTLAGRGLAPVETMRTELQLADQWLRPVMDARPDMVPEPVRQAFEMFSGLFDPRSPDTVTLRTRVRADRSALTDTGLGYADRLRHLTSLGIDLRMLFDQTEDLAVLREAVEIGREVVAATSPEHPDFEIHLSVLTVPLEILFERTGDLAVLREAVRFARYTAPLSPAGKPSIRGPWSCYCSSCSNTRVTSTPRMRPSGCSGRSWQHPVETTPTTPDTCPTSV